MNNINKILFVVPFSEDYDSLFFEFTNMTNYTMNKNNEKIRKFSFGLPMGVVALNSYIKKINPNIEINIIDFNTIIYNKIKDNSLSKNDKFEDIVLQKMEEVKNLYGEPDLIGISFNMTNEYTNTKIIASCLKKTFNKSVIASGGVTASHIYEKMLEECEELDAICLGEGEIPFKMLLNSSSIDEGFNECCAWVTRDKIGTGEKPIVMNNLDDLPIYDFSIFPEMDIYFETVYSNHMFKDKVVHEFNLATSRGCPYNCFFCTVKRIQGKKVRYHSEEWVFRTIDYLCETLKNTKFNCINLIDEIIFLKFDRAKRIIEYCKEKGIQVYVGNDSFITANEDVVKLVKDTGLGYVALPLESGSKRVLEKVIRKHFNIENVPKVIKMYRDAGLIVRVGVMIGLPGETKEDINDEIEYYKTLETDWLSINIATPFPGSDMYDYCVENKCFSCDDISKINLKRAVVTTADFTAEYIQDMSYYINLLINFKLNYNMRIGEYERALKMIKIAIDAASDHAIAYYYMSICYEKLNDIENSEKCMDKYKKICNDNIFWRNWATRLELI